MYGYILPDKPNLLIKEYALYRAHYCGACKATGKAFGQIPRLSVNYDEAFLSLFMHDYHDLNPAQRKAGCAFHPFRKMFVIDKSPLSPKICAANILLAYYKLKDDIADGGGLKKRAQAGFFKRSYKKAVKILPKADETIRGNYAKLSALEQQNCACPDEAADCFGAILRDVADILGEGAARHADPGQREALRDFFFHLGRWVYFADALDDLDEDFRDKRFNPFIAAHSARRTAHSESRTTPSVNADAPPAEGNLADRQFSILNSQFTKKSFLAANIDDLKLYFYPSVNAMSQTLSKFNFRMSENLLQNIVFYGICNMVERLLTADGKLERQRI